MYLCGCGAGISVEPRLGVGGLIQAYLRRLLQIDAL